MKREDVKRAKEIDRFLNQIDEYIDSGGNLLDLRTTIIIGKKQSGTRTLAEVFDAIGMDKGSTEENHETIIVPAQALIEKFIKTWKGQLEEELEIIGTDGPD